MIINFADELEQQIAKLRASAVTAIENIASLRSTLIPLTQLYGLKFDAIGCDPLNPERPLNLVEQLNQTFTYLASFKAVEQLFQLHPNLGPYKLNLGARAGSDIESIPPGNLAAEVFAAVNPSNNKKLSKDIDKVAKSKAVHKYVFFMCPGFQSGRQVRYDRDNVQVWSVGGL